MANAFAEHVTRFPASDPSKAENFKVGCEQQRPCHRQPGQRLGHQPASATGLLGKVHLADMDVHVKFEGLVPAMDYMTTTMSTQQGGTDGGSVTLLRPDGTPYPGSPFTGGGLPGPWAVAVDGNDNVWVSNFADAEQPDRAAVRRSHRDLSARHEDRRPDFSARRLRGWRPADADRYRHRSGRQRLGDEQLAGHRQLYRYAPRGAFDPLRRPGRYDLLRHGQAGARAADRASQTAVGTTRAHGIAAISPASSGSAVLRKISIRAHSWLNWLYPLNV